MIQFLLLLCGLISAQNFYESVDFIHQISTTEFSEVLLKSSGIWILEFYAPWCGHCKNFQSDFVLAAENLKGLVSFGAVNCDVEENKPLCGYFKVQSLPSVFALKSILEPIEVEGQKGYTKNPVKYEGPLKPAALAKWAANFLSDPIDAVLDIDSNTISSFLNFDKTKLKALVFTDKEKKSNLLRAIALNFRVDFLTTAWLPIGLVHNSNTEIVSKYQISNYPSLIIVNEEGEAVDKFTGQFNIKEITEYIQQFAHTPTEEDLNPPVKEKPKSKTPPPPPKKKEQILHHITDQESFDSACYPSGLCLIAFLDPEADEHQKFIQTLKEIVTKYSSVQVLWMDGNKHSEFKNAFGVADYMPQAVAYQRKAKRYRIFTAGFETELLGEFLDLVQAGTSKKGRISTLETEPLIESEDEVHEEL